MIRSKLDIFKKEWLDVVFAGRNKAYGAYELRKLAPRATNIGMLIASVVFVGLLVAPNLAKWLGMSDGQADIIEFVEHEVTLTEPPPIDEEEPLQPPPQEPPPPVTDQTRFLEPEVIPAEQVQDEDPPTIEALKLADPGTQTIAGDPNATLRIDLPVGEGALDSEVTESNPDQIFQFEALEQQPVPAEGSIDAFRTWVQRSYNYPRAAVDAGVNGQLEVTFVIERDGSITDIVVTRDLRFGTGEEAIRILRSAKKWTPGLQNGRPVRVAYTLPLKLATSTY